MGQYLLEEVVRRYEGLRGGGSVEALRVPRLEVEAGEALAVVGANGSGKSTLLETMAFLYRPEQGRVLFDCRDVWADGGALETRRRCPILLQKTVLFKRTVLENVMYGLRVRGLEARDARGRAEAVLTQVGLQGLADRGNRELSGGERRRVALARVLALEPDVLLLDEPTAQVDQDNARLIEKVIEELRKRRQTTVILASHDPQQAESLADRVVRLERGRLVEEGTGRSAKGDPKMG